MDFLIEFIRLIQIIELFFAYKKSKGHPTRDALTIEIYSLLTRSLSLITRSS